MSARLMLSLLLFLALAAGARADNEFSRQLQESQKELMSCPTDKALDAVLVLFRRMETGDVGKDEQWEKLTPSQREYSIMASAMSLSRAARCKARTSDQWAMNQAAFEALRRLEFLQDPERAKGWDPQDKMSWILDLLDKPDENSPPLCSLAQLGILLTQMEGAMHGNAYGIGQLKRLAAHAGGLGETCPSCIATRQAVHGQLAMQLMEQGWVDEAAAQMKLGAATKGVNPLWTKAMNFWMGTLRNGPSEAPVTQTMALCEDMIKDGADESVTIMLLVIMNEGCLSSHRQEREGALTLESIFEDAKERPGSPQDFPAYTPEVSVARDYLILRTRTGQVGGLEADFLAVLEWARSRGWKNQEPAIYAAYAEFLSTQGRNAEALKVLEVGEKVARQSGDPLSMAKVLEGTWRVLVRTEAWADAENTRRALEVVLKGVAPGPAWTIRTDQLRLLSSSGTLGVWNEQKEAMRALEPAFPPPKWLAEAAASVSAPDPERKRSAAVKSRAPLDLQPKLNDIVLADGEPMRVRWILSNPGSSESQGALVFNGLREAPAVNETDRIIEARVGPGTVSDQEVPLQVRPGEQWLVYLEGRPESLPHQGEIAWVPQSGEKQPVVWTVAAEDEKNKDKVVSSNVSLAAWNPYYMVSFYHDLRARKGAPERAVFRVKASSPCRIEFIEASTGRLLAIDAEGNGSFRDPSDLIVGEALREERAPCLKWGSDGAAGLEFYVYPTKARPAGGKIQLTLELHDGTAWKPVVRDELALP